MRPAVRGRRARATVVVLLVTGLVAVLTVEYSAADGDELAPLGLILNGAEQFGLSGAVGLRLVDPDALMVSPVLESADGDHLASGARDLHPIDGSATSRSVHAVPAGDRVDVFLPLLGAVTDVPVVPAETGFDTAVEELGAPQDGATGLELRSYTIGLEDEVTDALRTHLGDGYAVKAEGRAGPAVGSNQGMVTCDAS